MNVGRTHRLKAEDILAATDELGGEATRQVLLNRFPQVGIATLTRRLQELTSAGELVRPARGVYARPGTALALSPIAQELVGVLQDHGIEGHLTGFDLLGAYAHQFVFEYPHIVIAEPSSYDDAELELSRSGFVAVAAGPAASGTAAETSRLVLLRRQPDAERRFGVRRYLAPVEKAWVDLLRETLKSRLPFQFMELGRILRNMEDGGADMRRLRSYAKRLGYIGWVDAAQQHRLDVQNLDMASLVAGYWTP